MAPRTLGGVTEGTALHVNVESHRRQLSDRGYKFVELQTNSRECTAHGIDSRLTVLPVVANDQCVIHIRPEAGSRQAVLDKSTEAVRP
eukprot:1066222-Heterocapsa_arctica.AAC.1